MTDEKEAKYFADKHLIETKGLDKLSKKEFLVMGVLPENYDKIILEKRGVNYFKEVIQEYIDKTWAELKLGIDLELFRTSLNLSELDLKEIWNKEKKDTQKEQKDLQKEYDDKNKIDKSAARIFSKKGQAQEFSERQPIFYDKSGLWWMWDKKKMYWSLTDEIDILNMIEQSTGADVISSQSRNEIINSLKQEGRKNIPKPAPNTWIQFNNGIIDVYNPDEILIPNPFYFITNPLPWDIGESSNTPTMDRIFEEWVGKDYVQTLYEIIAYCALTDYPIHRIFCFIGAGLNGKSKYLELLRTFIGNDNVTSTELDVLLNSRFEVTRLHKKLVCQMGETNFSEMSKTSILKKLSGGDLIGFEYKGKTPFEDKNYAKIIISTNNLPTTSDKTIGFYRRWMIIDFPNHFSEKKDILSDIPIEEYNNLARKCVLLLKDLLNKREFTREGTIEERIKKYQDKSDPLEKFMQEFTSDDPDAHIFKFEFEKRLNEWCKENRFRVMAENTIGRKMKEKGVNQQYMMAEWLSEGTNKRLRAWIGIKWKDSIQVVQDNQVSLSQNPIRELSGNNLIIPNNPSNIQKEYYHDY